MARRGFARRCRAWRGEAWYADARRGQARHGVARSGWARLGEARLCTEGPGKARRGTAVQGRVRQGGGRLGEAWRGTRWLGRARRGKAWSMKLETVKLVKLSICECGYAVLLDSIRLGTEYVIDRATLRGGFFYECGVCMKQQIDVRVVDADRPGSPGAGLRPLPAELFGL